MWNYFPPLSSGGNHGDSLTCILCLNSPTIPVLSNNDDTQRDWVKVRVGGGN